MNTSQIINENELATDLGVHEKLALLGLVDEVVNYESSESPVVADLFSNLWKLVGNTVSGAKVDFLKTRETSNGFKVFEINAESGENLGRLNMLYLKKPLPCYYLVYVEVSAPFRNKGLGNLVLKAFREFLIEKNALGFLDNIIPESDPTYDIYRKMDWVRVESLVGGPINGSGSLYMAFVPPSLRGRDLRDPLLKLVHHLKRRRAVIDMRDNELMVKRTIDEFKEIYKALLTYFADTIATDPNSPVMRYMFTRFVTKLIGFKRRIASLIGYTGGESMEQIVLDQSIRNLRIQSYAPRELTGKPLFLRGDKKIWLQLNEDFKNDPARTIEMLPNYRRPSLLSWLEETGKPISDPFTIGDLLDLGFDPTRLKEFTINNEPYIVERMQSRLLPEVERKKVFLNEFADVVIGKKVKSAQLLINPPLLIIGDRGNAYIIRKKVVGIHWEEAIQQLQSAEHLKALNRTLGLDKLVKSTIARSRQWVKARVCEDLHEILEQFSFFVSWDLESNQPKVVVDPSGTYIQSVWIA